MILSSTYSPHLLPKARSQAIKDAIGGLQTGMVQPYPCTLRIASLLPGWSCAPRATVVPCHPLGHGKGMSTKVSDFPMIAACHRCHDLLDYRDKRMFDLDYDPATSLLVRKRIIHALGETQVMLAVQGVVIIPDVVWT